METGIIVETLDKSHNREIFDCGIDELNIFLKRYARQNQANSISNTFVAVNKSEAKTTKKNILGFYTLASGQIDASSLPNKQKHPAYPVSIARLARLAVDLNHQNKGIGGYLLFDAINKIRAAADLIGIFAIVVDAKESAKSFYEHYRFIELSNSPCTFFLPMETIKKLV